MVPVPGPCLPSRRGFGKKLKIFKTTQLGLKSRLFPLPHQYGTFVADGRLGTPCLLRNLCYGTFVAEDGWLGTPCFYGTFVTKPFFRTGGLAPPTCP